MLKPRWRKVLRDLWLNKLRTVLVVLSIAVGVFAVGTIANSQIILSTDLIATYLATNPSNGNILTFSPFNDDVVEAVQAMREVEEAEARRAVTVRLNTGPDEWLPTRLIAIPDYDDIKIDTITPLEGEWPPPENSMLIERAALGLTNAQVGDTVLIKTPDGKERHMPIAGLAHDLNAQMFVFDGTGYGFITFDTLEWLDQAKNYNEMKVVVADHGNDREYIRKVVNKVRDKIERSGSSVLFTLIPTPGQPPLNFLIQAISIILGALGALSLLLSGFLVVNTVSALVTQQTRQIGMMKAVGARTLQVIGMYLSMVLIFGLLALVIAVPVGMVSAFYFSRFIASYMNFDITDFRLSREVLLMQVVVGLVVPLTVALYPIIAGTRVTVREAISAYGLGKGAFGSNKIDRLLMYIQHVPLLRHNISRPLLISLRNTFRRKGRLVLTLLTLIIGGAIFISVFSVRASLLDTLDTLLDYFQYDVGVHLDRDYRIERIKHETLKVPGIQQAESWGFYNGRRKRPDGTDSDNIFIFAPPAETTLVKPTLVEGRWLRADDTNAIVINTIVLRDEPDLKLGDEIILKIEGREKSWRIVGVVKGGSLFSTIFANYPYFAKVAHDIGRAEWVFTTIEKHDIEAQTDMARAIEAHFERVGLGVDIVSIVAQERAEAEIMFEVIVVLLLMMSVLLAVIGGLGLMGTMSINVLERTREIGVMRAIGASNWAVQRIFIIESIIIGLISWVVGVLLAIPVSKVLSDVVGQQFLGASLNYIFSIPGSLIWLVTVIILAAVASFLPARNASRVTVREVLAYE